jgi:hypothetical protein
VDRSHRRGVPHKTNLADSADSARNVNDPLTVRLVCTKIPYQSIYGRNNYLGIWGNCLIAKGANRIAKRFPRAVLSIHEYFLI